MDPINSEDLTCLLCRKSMSYKDNKNDYFFQHLKHDHNVLFDFDFILAVCFFDKESKRVVIDNIDNNKKNVALGMEEDEDDESDVEEDFSDEDSENTDNNKVTRGSENDDDGNIDMDQDETDDFIGEENDANGFTNENFKCSICLEILKSFSELELHKANHSGRFTCSICSKTFSKIGDLNNHKIEAHNQEPTVFSGGNFECFQCKRTFLTNKQFKKHRSNTNPKHQLYPPGEGSNIETATSDNSKNNENIMDSNDTTSFLDNQDEEKATTENESDFETEPDLDILISKVKNELDKVEGVLTGDYANESTNFESILTNALGGNNEKESLDRSTENFQCPSCDKVFTHNSSFKRHKKIHSEEKGVFTCEPCQKSFSQKTNLNRHNKNVHK